MKKTAIYTIIIVVASLCGSCGSKKPVDYIMVPDSTKVADAAPMIEGSLGEFYEIVPGQYFIDVTDSIPVMDVTLRLVQNFTPSPENFAFPRIITSADAPVASPYIVVVDKHDKVIPGLVMEIEPSLLEQLEAMIIGDAGEDVGIHCVATTSMSEKEKKLLAKKAYNFRIAGNVDFVSESLDAACDTIDTEYM